MDSTQQQSTQSRGRSYRNTRINNMYNTPEHRKIRASIRNSIIKKTISKNDKNTIYRTITNERVAKCNKACKEDERGRIGSCVITNTTIGLKDCTNPDGKTRYHYIRPTELAVDTLQWAFNTGKAKIITDESSKSRTDSYLVFNDFPSLQIETVETDKDGEYRDTRRNDGFFQAYEDNTTQEKLNYSTQLQEYLATGIYHNAVKYTTSKDSKYMNGITTQDINYVKVIATGLEKAYTFSNIANTRANSQANTPASGFNAKLTNLDALTGDLAGMGKYIIVEPMTLADGEYVICGYPDLSKMHTYLSLRNDPIIGKALNDIYTMQRTNFATLFAEMHNSVLKDGDGNRIELSQLDTEIHKFMKSINITYFESWVKANTELDASNPNAWVNSADYKGKIQLLRDNGLEAQADYIESEIARTCLTPEERTQQLANIPIVYAAFAKYVNELLLEYLNKPMTRIRYHFLIYRRTPEGTLVPAIFNIKQLEPQYKPLLERVQDLIQMRIPEIFGILKDSRHRIDRYKLFHSYVKYGDFFYITTEYLHTMANFTHYAYLYENSMELEELIYSLSRVSIVPNFWQSLRIDYQLKKFRVLKQEAPLTLSGGSRGVKSGLHMSRSNRNKNWRSGKRNTRTSMNTIKTNLKGTIMMIYEKSYQEYTIIYKDAGDGVFKVLEVKSNLAACTRDIINNVKLPKSSGNSVIKYSDRLFKVVRIYKLDDDTIKLLKNYNPLVVKIMKKPNTESRTISIKDMIKTELLDNNMLEDIQIINVGHFHPIIYFNFLMNMNYILALLKYNSKATTSISNNYIQDMNNSTTQYGKYYAVDCIINPENCGYNIIMSSRTLDKIVLWILPHIDGQSVENTKYLHNFTYLESSHIALLEVIKKTFVKEQDICFVHIQAVNIFGLFHLHLSKYDDYYKRQYPFDKQKGTLITLITREINIDDIIFRLKLDTNYYKNYNVPKLNAII